MTIFGGEDGRPGCPLCDREKGRMYERPNYSSFIMGDQQMLKTEKARGSSMCMLLNNIKVNNKNS